MTKKWIDLKNTSTRGLLGSALLATATLGFAGAAQALDLRFGHGGTEDTAYQLGAERFKELLAEASDGEMDVQIMGIQCSATRLKCLNSRWPAHWTVPTIKLGDDCSLYTANVFSIPFLYRDEDHWSQVLDGEVGRAIADQITAETDVRVLAFYSVAASARSLAPSRWRALMISKA